MEAPHNGMSAELPTPYDNPNPTFLLDMLIPGFSTVSAIANSHCNIDLNIYIPFIAFALFTIWAARKSVGFLKSVGRQYFMTSAEIRIDDEMYNYVMGWIAVQPFSSKSHRFIAQSSVDSKNFMIWYTHYRDGKDKGEEEEELEIEMDKDGLPTPKKRKEKPLNYTPGIGTHLFWWKYRPFLFHRHVPGCSDGGYVSPSEKEEISISTFGRNPEPLKKLLMDCKSLSSKADLNKTLIYRGASKPGPTNDLTWVRSLSRVARPMTSVVMDEVIKREVLEDVAEYLAPKTRRWYANRGIPYRRGYLLYGAPGTGKSSLSLALSGRFGLSIYIVSLNSPMMNEESLASLFSELPPRCVVLLEDIDTAGLTHLREDEKGSEKVAVKKVSKSGKGEVQLVANDEKTQGKISLSALLNVLDGVASQEGRVLIMTTNHVDKLDEALVRPGRVDMKIEFKLADKAMMAALFRSIYTKVDGDDAKVELKQIEVQFNGFVASGAKSTLAVITRTGAEKSKNEIEKKEKEAKQKLEEEQERERIKLLAVQFAGIMPEHEFSPAEVQGFLLKNKRHSERAIETAAQWIKATRIEKNIREEKEKREVAEKIARQKKDAQEQKAEELKAEQEMENQVRP